MLKEFDISPHHTWKLYRKKKKTSEKESGLVIFEALLWNSGYLTVPLNSVILLMRAISAESTCRAMQQRETIAAAHQNDRLK